MDVNTYLSNVAVQFFRNMYKMRYVASPAKFWGVTPGIPWRHVCGFLIDDEFDGKDDLDETSDVNINSHINN